MEKEKKIWVSECRSAGWIDGWMDGWEVLRVRHSYRTAGLGNIERYIRNYSLSSFSLEQGIRVYERRLGVLVPGMVDFFGG